MKAAAKAFKVSVKLVTVKITAWADGGWRVTVWHTRSTPSGDGLGAPEERAEVSAKATTLIDALTKTRDKAQRGEVRMG